MLYLQTDHEETRQQVLAAIAEADGIGEVRTVASPEKLREYFDPDATTCVLVDEALAPHHSRVFSCLPTHSRRPVKPDSYIRQRCRSDGLRGKDGLGSSNVTRGDNKPSSSCPGVVTRSSQRSV